MAKAREIFRRNFPHLEASGRVEFRRRQTTSLNGYQLKLVKAPKYNKRWATDVCAEVKAGFRRTGRSPLLIISPH